MAHIHPVYDTDIHFKIDPVSRAITTEDELKNIVQFDHNSERFSFDIPKTVDGHDMTKCNKVRVHYINTDSSNRSTTSGVYEVTDMQPLDDDRLVLTWLITANATQKVGPLDFLVEFLCTNEAGEIEYAWHTGIYSSIPVSKGMNNSPDVVNTYPDILEQWKAEILAGGGGGGASSWSDLGETTTYGDTLTWDGNTEGLVSVADAFYKVSELKPELKNGMNGVTIELCLPAEGLTETFTGKMTDTVGDGILTCQCVDGTDASVLIVTEKAIGVETEFGVASETGIYFVKVEGEAYVSSFTIHDYTETVPLPNKYLDIIETVGGDTLTWDGNTSGLTAFGTFCKVSDSAVSTDDLQNGGTAVFDTMTIQFTSEDIVPLADNLNGVMHPTGMPIIFFALADNIDMGDGDFIPEKGIYFAQFEAEGYTTSLTINGYTGFTKEQVKEEYLPSGATVFYLDPNGEDMTYFYVDGEGTTKATKEDVENAISKGAIYIYSESVGYVVPISIMDVDGCYRLGAQVYTGMEGSEFVGVALYTSEYTS